MSIPLKRDTQVLFNFGGFSLDLQRRGLYRGSERIHLTPKPLEVLIYLVQNRGRPVEKSELLDAVWEGVFVTEDNLVQAIMEIRRALGDNKDDPRFIQTIPRQGYRFVAEVTWEDTRLKLPFAAKTPLTLQESNRALNYGLIRNAKGNLARATLSTLTLALIFAGAGIGLFIVFRQGRPAIKPRMLFENIKVTRITTSGTIMSAAISPDGKYVVYARNIEGQESLWLKQTAAASEVQVTKPAQILHRELTFSLDGSSFYYLLRNTGGAGELFQMSLLGGIAKKLITDIDSAITFSPDGKQISFFRGYPEKGETKLVIANADGTQQHEVVTRRRPDFFPTLLDSGPSWSPVNALIACAVGGSDSKGRMTVIGFPADGGATVPLTSRRWWHVGNVAWLPDGSGLMMVVKERASDPSQIWYLSYPTGEARRVTSDLNNYLGVSLTRTSPVALVTIQSHVLSSVSVAPDQKDALNIPISSVDGVTGISWTPHGRIVYAARLHGNLDVYSMDQDGSNKEQLTADASDNNWPSVSPDGRYIVFMSNRTGTNAIWRMNLDGSDARPLTSEGDARWPRCSPDSQWVVYASLSNPAGLYKIPIEGGNPVRLTDVRPTQPAISPNGKQIATGYFEDPDATKAAIYSSEGGAPLRILNLSSFYLRWTPDGKALMNIDRHDIPNIVIQPLAGGPPKQLTHFKDGAISSCDWSSEGRLACSRKVAISDAVIVNSVE
jgi:Tol biopolymer transport system component/DNA-binding winged helix-turn-helix (wHTH) protein